MKPFALFIPIILFAGCSNPRLDVPGTLEPGNVDQVTNRVYSNSNANHTESIGLLPFNEIAPDAEPVVQLPQVEEMHWFGRVSKDGMAEHGGETIVFMLSIPQFSRDKGRNQGLISLDTLNNVQVGKDGRVRLVQPNNSNNARNAHQGPVVRPWGPGSQNQTQPVIVYENKNNPATVVNPPTQPSGNLYNKDGTPNQQAIDSMIQTYTNKTQENKK